MRSTTQLSADVQAVVAGCNAFGADLFAALSGSEENLFFSPSSIAIALAMTYAGARGETAREMSRVLHLGLPPDQLHPAFRELQTNTRTGGIELRIANRLWGQIGYRFLPDYLHVTEECYGAKLAEEDFVSEPESARCRINQWVAHQTRERIKEIVPPGALDNMTRLVLTNAIYFLGTWESEFDPADTKVRPFRSANDVAGVPMMQQTAYFGFHENEQFQLLEMPYRSCKYVLHEDADEGTTVTEDKSAGSDMAMCVLLPRERDGLKQLGATALSGLISAVPSLKTESVDVWLPRFRIETMFSLAETLKGLGMKQAFSRVDADFSGMTDDPEGLFIAAALHKAFVDVNEEGTEAAAATAIPVGGGGGYVQTKLFHADHPFLFVIRDTATKLIHFVGKVT